MKVLYFKYKKNRLSCYIVFYISLYQTSAIYTKIHQP